ncbi:hypothetical protein PR048_002119 [Dryococelus australis]|uniref:Uncharacterized protein n=1 Tax=Dryococelus australis TaxID=614101 RepID=A0ABQ9IJF4_9NEOP|nr:hypothetical protein PR048_002119 [Dryococelus australis]
MYEWLAYSKKVSGGLCQMCILFGRCEGETNNVKLGKLVVMPLNTYKKAVETLKHQASTDYHKGNMIMQAAEKKVIEENRKKLIPIIKAVIFCGAQNIPLRRHRDKGDLQTELEKNMKKFQIDAGDGDSSLTYSLRDKNSNYISKTTQNEIIQRRGDAITKKMFANIINTKYFTIMADETNISYCCSQAYDGGSDMSGKFKGVRPGTYCKSTATGHLQPLCKS